MSQYRPDNWDKIRGETRKRYCPFTNDITTDRMDAFEAGADAMLEGLFKMAEESPTGTFVIDSRTVNIYKTIPNK